MTGAGEQPRPTEPERSPRPAVREPYRQAMSRMASGVVIVTCEVDGRPWGITATACCSISIEPALILVSLQSSTVSAATIGKGGRFGVSVLGSRGVEAARFASNSGQPKFIEAYCDRSGAPANPKVDGSTAHVDCVVRQRHPVADHLLFIGEVESVQLRPCEEPLVYCEHGYHGLVDLGGAGAGG